MSEKLRECPFGSDNIEPADNGLTVFCGGTYYSEEAEMEMEYCYSVPIEVFNRRPTEDRLREENERLRELGKEFIWDEENPFEYESEMTKLRQRVRELEKQLIPGVKMMVDTVNSCEGDYIAIKKDFFYNIMSKAGIQYVYPGYIKSIKVLTTPATEAEGDNEQ